MSAKKDRDNERDPIRRRLLHWKWRQALRKETRIWTSRETAQVLSEFKGLSRLDMISHAPVERNIPAKRPDDEDFAKSLADVYARPTPPTKPLPHESMRDVRKFTMGELQKVLQFLARNKSADTAGIALEHLLHLPHSVLQNILDEYNVCINKGFFPKDWLHTIFTMLPKSGDASKTSNWRPIAIQKILYKVFSKMVWLRIAPLLEAAQCKDQCAYRPGYGSDEALHCVEYMTGFAHAFKVDLWIVSLDLSKAFDKVFHECVIEAILEQGVDEAHACLLQELYWEQTGQVGSSDWFQIFSGVRQGDVLRSALLYSTP